MRAKLSRNFIMKKYISLDEHLHLIAEKATRKCVGNPIQDELPVFNFQEKEIKYPKKNHSIATVI